MLITKKDAAFLFKHRATSNKHQATSSPQSGGIKRYENK
jgi:hypothetical protein